MIEAERYFQMRAYVDRFQRPMDALRRVREFNEAVTRVTLPADVQQAVQDALRNELRRLGR